jgi:hypothetical protein
MYTYHLMSKKLLILVTSHERLCHCMTETFMYDDKFFLLFQIVLAQPRTANNYSFLTIKITLEGKCHTHVSFKAYDGNSALIKVALSIPSLDQSSRRGLKRIFVFST